MKITDIFCLRKYFSYKKRHAQPPYPAKSYLGHLLSVGNIFERQRQNERTKQNREENRLMELLSMKFMSLMFRNSKVLSLFDSDEMLENFLTSILHITYVIEDSLNMDSISTAEFLFINYE